VKRKGLENIPSEILEKQSNYLRMNMRVWKQILHKRFLKKKEKCLFINFGIWIFYLIIVKFLIMSVLWFSKKLIVKKSWFKIQIYYPSSLLEICYYFLSKQSWKMLNLNSRSYKKYPVKSMNSEKKLPFLILSCNFYW